MKLLIFSFFIILATCNIVGATNPNEETQQEEREAETMTSLRGVIRQQEEEEAEAEAMTSPRGVIRRFLATTKVQSSIANLTCDKFPQVCSWKSSKGPHCCKKKCVDVRTDSLNCGMCGYKCKYTEICCKEKCVNSSFDRRHCGGCNKKCKKGEHCVYGMCNYA